jgi:pimeloyl-ACP methyl ester carboxylesterase
VERIDTDYLIVGAGAAGMAFADTLLSETDARISGSGDGPERTTFGRLGPSMRLLDNTVDPPALPSWLTDADLDYYAAEFRRTGFRGGLNWYRNITRSWQLLAPWRGVVIHQPSLFIAGARDDVLKFPSSRPQINNFASSLPGLRGSHILDGAGHWIQRERAAMVNELMLGFLRSL